ncbi:MAG: cupredoxin domain-containing protein [Chloroflexota bacterium]
MKTLLATAAVSVLLLAACGTAGGSGAPTVNANARTVNATLTDSKVTVDQGTVSSGKITFNVKNAGTVVHELVVLKTDLAPDKIPADLEEPGKVSEADSLGESGDVNKGETKAFSLDLQPGNYVLMCNELGHYVMGMHIGIVVK